MLKVSAKDVPSPLATKYRALVFAGLTAIRASLPGLEIGVGGRPTLR